MAGAAVAKAGFGVLVASGLRTIGVFIVLSPLIGLALGLIVTLAIFWTFRRNRDVERLNRGFRHGQLASAAAFSLGHGANDAQKTMGVILALLIATGHASPGGSTPLWVVLSAHTAIALGTLTGGWRIVKTMGSRITRLQPVGGVAAESAAAVTLFATSAGGIPVSTTHTITGGIVGSGPPAGCRRCAGAWRAASCGRGCSRSRARSQWRSCRTCSWT
jgi:PiT family inorganic phosphate transporter